MKNILLPLLLVATICRLLPGEDDARLTNYFSVWKGVRQITPVFWEKINGKSISIDNLNIPNLIDFAKSSLKAISLDEPIGPLDFSIKYIHDKPAYFVFSLRATTEKQMQKTETLVLIEYPDGSLSLPRPIDDSDKGYIPKGLSIKNFDTQTNP